MLLSPISNHTAFVFTRMEQEPSILLSKKTEFPVAKPTTSRSAGYVDGSAGGQDDSSRAEIRINRKGRKERKDGKYL